MVLTLPEPFRNPRSEPCQLPLTSANSTPFPPGRICGQRCIIAPDGSARESVRRVGAPPAPDTWNRPPDSAATIVSSSPQLPPAAPGALHKLTPSPPSSDTFWSLPPAKKATHRPLGEKNGREAPSVPERRVSFAWSRRRVASAPLETKTVCMPSDEIAGCENPS